VKLISSNQPIDNNLLTATPTSDEKSFELEFSDDSSADSPEVVVQENRPYRPGLTLVKKDLLSVLYSDAKDSMVASTSSVSTSHLSANSSSMTQNQDTGGMFA
jgi:hypothetical protein